MARIYWTYDELLEETHRRATSVEILGYTLDGSPLVAARGGGDKTPAILITAGSHSTEQAGVSAAVELIDTLNTEHAVYVIPTRDPVGMKGFAHALSLGLGDGVEATSFEQIETLLRAGGDVLFEEDDMLLVLAGEFGYATSRPAAHKPCPQYFLYQRLQRLRKEKPETFAPLIGRRVYMTPGQAGVEGTGDFGRAYTLIISPEGEVLHINRFHDTAWAPIEPRVTRDLMARIRPGLSFDLHESQLMDDRFFLSARRQQTDALQAQEEAAAERIMASIAESGATIATQADVDALGGWFDASDGGVFWLDASRRGEGYNLMDFASVTYGLAFGTEMGMFGTFDGRVDMALRTVRGATEVLEAHHR